MTMAVRCCCCATCHRHAAGELDALLEAQRTLGKRDQELAGMVRGEQCLSCRRQGVTSCVLEDVILGGGSKHGSCGTAAAVPLGAACAVHA
jgi:hypothetical protein